MADPNRIEATEVGSVAVITVVGEHDLASEPSLADTVARLARPGAVMVIDLAPATFIDSTVLHALTQAAKNADTLAVVAPPGQICRRLIDVVGVAACFTACDSTDQALRAVLGSTQPRDSDHAVGLLHLADQLLDLAWAEGRDTDEPLALAQKLCTAVGREPLIEEAKVLIADAQRCLPSEAFQRLIQLSQQRNEKLAHLARRLVEGLPLHGERAAPSSTARLVEEIVSAFERRDAARLAQLVHPDAVIQPRPSPKPLHGPREVTGYIEAIRQRVATVSVTAIQDIASDAVLIEGREQWQTPDNTILDTPVVWVVRFRDGLIWRTRTYPNRNQALGHERDTPADSRQGVGHSPTASGPAE